VRRLAIGAAALGAGWGYGAAVFFPGGVDHQVFLSFIVALVTAGALPIFSTLWWVYAIYAGRGDAAVQRGAVLAWHRVPAPARRGGAAASTSPT
jgi:hypothetical protein